MNAPWTSSLQGGRGGRKDEPQPMDVDIVKGKGKDQKGKKGKSKDSKGTKGRTKESQKESPATARAGATGQTAKGGSHKAAAAAGTTAAGPAAARGATLTGAAERRVAGVAEARTARESSRRAKAMDVPFAATPGTGRMNAQRGRASR